MVPIRLLEDQPIEDIERDHLGLKPWAEMIARAALGTRGPFTIGVHGAWGYGKTTLLKLTQALVKKHDKGVVAVWFNAWQFEREEHPLFPLIAAIANEIETKKKAAKGIRDIGAALRALTRGMKFSGEVGMPFIGKVGVEFDPQKAIEAEEIIGKQMNPLQGEMLYHSAFTMLEGIARKESGAKIVVFVDDLDRCQPDKAVALLESIKLILSQPGFVFVLAVHRQLVESFLQKCYMERFGAPEGDWGRFYMEKIIQLPIEIPSHRSRFGTYVERVLAELDKEGWKNTEPIKALKGIQTVLATGAGTNPRRPRPTRLAAHQHPMGARSDPQARCTLKGGVVRFPSAPSL